MILRTFIAKYFDGKVPVVLDPSEILNKQLALTLVNVDWYSIDIRGWRIVYYIDKRSQNKKNYNLKFCYAICIDNQSIRCKSIKQLEQYITVHKDAIRAQLILQI